jgi:hypothetical protein
VTRPCSRTDPWPRTTPRRHSRRGGCVLEIRGGGSRNAARSQGWEIDRRDVASPISSSRSLAAQSSKLPAPPAIREKAEQMAMSNDPAAVSAAAASPPERALSSGAAIGIRHRVVEVNGAPTRRAEAGDGPLVLLLHGFPESWYSWRHRLRALAEAGFHAVAPSQRGYPGTQAPGRRHRLLDSASGQRRGRADRVARRRQRDRDRPQAAR